MEDAEKRLSDDEEADVVVYSEGAIILSSTKHRWCQLIAVRFLSLLRMHHSAPWAARAAFLFYFIPHRSPPRYKTHPPTSLASTEEIKLCHAMLDAARDGRKEEVERLLDAGADALFQREEDLVSALMLAAGGGHKDVLQLVRG